MPTEEAQVLEVVRPGACLTIQDLGRWGWAGLGVSPSGAMDARAHAVANRLVGNLPVAAALEVTGPGCELVFLQEVSCALAGGDLGAELDGRALPTCWVGEIGAGQRLRFPVRRRGARVSVALAGGLAAPLVLGSAASDLGAGLGPPPLRAGDRLAVAWPEIASTARRGIGGAELRSQEHLQRAYAALWEGWAFPLELRFLPVADPDSQISAALQIASESTFRLSPQSNRVGFRFEGPALPVAPDPTRLSEPTAPGTIQVPGDGRPIVLMADRNTTGGYAKLGYLASADVWKAAQLWPGDQICFRALSEETAVALYRTQNAAFTEYSPG